MMIQNINTPLIVGLAIGLFVLLLGLLLLFFYRKRTCFKVDEELISGIISCLGGKNNIEKTSVDNKRVKFVLFDLDKANFEGLKDLGSEGVFISGNNVKCLFKIDSLDISNAITKKLGEKDA